MNRLARISVAGLLLWACHLGCTKKNAETPKGPDPEANSGPDAKRAGATPIEINKAYTDGVDFDKGDRTDWKSVDLKGQPGNLDVILHWDTAAADLTVDVFDGIGVQVATSPPNSGEPTKKVTVPIQEMGTYFIRIQAPKAGVASDYTVEAKWQGEAAPPPPPPPPVVEKEEPVHKQHREAKAPKPKKTKGGSPENALQGRIVGFHAEGGGAVLYLDKGSTAGVAEGQNGWILEGPSGFSVLDGGTFTITKVVDENRSVGKTPLKAINRNTRVAINTGK